MKKSLVEKLSKRINSLREAAGEISDKEVLKLLKNPTPTLKKAMKINYGANTYMGFDLINKTINECKKQGTIHIYDEDGGIIAPYFMKYCICKASGVESGIDINKIITEHFKSRLKWCEKTYKEELPDSNYTNFYDDEDALDYIRKFRRMRKDEVDREAKELIKMGIKPEDILLLEENDAVDTFTDLDFIIQAELFAKACGANDLANRIKPIAEKAKNLEKYMIWAA